MIQYALALAHEDLSRLIKPLKTLYEGDPMVPSRAPRPFDEFVRFLQVSQQTLRRLLESIKLSSTEEEMEKVRGYCKDLKYNDFYDLELKGSMRGLTWQQLRGAIQKGQKHVQILVWLYEEYCREFSIRMNSACPCPYTEDELIFHLTGGYVKLSEFFLLSEKEGLIFSWDDEFNTYMYKHDDDLELAQCCYAYLKSRGYCYQSVEEYLRERPNRPADPPCVSGNENVP